MIKEEKLVSIIMSAYNYENTIKTNFASSLREILIIKLLEKQWLLNPMIQEK